MKSFKQFEKCKLLQVGHGNNSIYGNPCCYITFVDSSDKFHRAKTASNALAGYEAENYCYCESGHPIYLQYHYTRGGNCIVDKIKHPHPYDAKKEAENVL